MKKIIFIIFLTLPLIFFNTCIFFTINNDYDLEQGFFVNNSEYNIYIQEFYYHEHYNTGDKIYYDYGTIISKKEKVIGAPLLNYYSRTLEKIVFVDTDTHKHLRSISAAEYFSRLEMHDVIKQKNNDGGKTTYLNYHYEITDEFLNKN